MTRKLGVIIFLKCIFLKILVHNHVTWNCFRPILTYSHWRNLLAAWNFTFRCGDTKICRRDLKRHFIYDSIQKINLAASHRLLLSPQIVECQNKISSCLRDALGWFISCHSSKSMPILDWSFRIDFCFSLANQGVSAQ